MRDDWNMQVATPQKATTRAAGIRFDRNELSGAFGDIGTDFPLIVGLILAAHLDPASVLTVFGCMQILTGLLYRMPMPAQPLKAMAVLLVISQKLGGNILYGAGLARLRSPGLQSSQLMYFCTSFFCTKAA